MRVVLAGLFVSLLVFTGPSHGGQGMTDESQPPAEATAEDETLDLKGCSACTLRHQAVTRRLKEKRAQGPPDKNSLVKGDINSIGERIYHLPGDRYYDWISISAERGERWFCSAAEAENGGWRAVQ